MAAAPHRSASGLASERGSILVQVGVAMIVLIAFTRLRGRLRPDVGGAAPGAERGRRRRARRRHRARIRRLRRSQRHGTGETVGAQRCGQPIAWPAKRLRWTSTPTCTSTTTIPTSFPTNAPTTPAFAWTYTATRTRSNPLPIWFGQLVGLVDQGVRATAIARAAFGNATDCMKPWAVVDRWDEHWEDGMPVTFPPTRGTGTRISTNTTRTGISIRASPRPTMYDAGNRHV